MKGRETDINRMRKIQKIRLKNACKLVHKKWDKNQFLKVLARKINGQIMESMSTVNKI